MIVGGDLNMLHGGLAHLDNKPEIMADFKAFSELLDHLDKEPGSR